MASRRRTPAVWLTDGLIWTRDGTVWAVWRLDALSYGLRPTRDKIAVRAVHTALLRTFNGEALYLSTVANGDPAAQVERMIDGIDLEEHPEWALEAEAQLDQLENMPIGQRVNWVAVPLRNGGPIKALREMGRAAMYDLADQAGVARPPVPPAAVAARRAQAEEIRKQIPAPFQARPATRQEIVWIYDHSKQRGLPGSTPLGPSGPEDLVMRTGAALVNPILDEGGLSDLPTTRSRALVNPFSRRYLKITDPATEQISYQVHLALLDLPPGGLTFPDGEWMGRLDESGIEVDWAMRTRVVAREKVMASNARALRELNDQYEQQGAGGLMSGLDQNATMLATYDQIFAADENELEISVTTILTVSAPTAQAAQDLATALRAHLGPGNWQLKVSTEIGAQEDLFWAGLPGVAAAPIVGQLAQITTTSDLAGSTFFTTTAVGDPSGFPAAIEISAERVSLVLLDIVNASAKLNKAIAFAACGELGSGKSYFLKTVANHLISRGAQVLAIDRTPVGEWERAVGHRPGAQTVALSEESQYSVDPLRILPPQLGAEVALTFLQVLLDFSDSDLHGTLMAKVLSPASRREHGLDGLADVADHLATFPDGTLERGLGDRLQIQAARSYARPVFGRDLPPLDLTAPVLVFRVDQVQLPTDAEISNSNLFRQLSAQKIFGRAANALILNLGRRVCFADPTTLSVLFVDETKTFTAYSETRHELGLWLRDGRKHLAGLGFGSHDAEEDFGGLVEVELIALRLLMRHTSEKLAARGLDWLGLDATDRDLLDIVMTDLSPIPAEEEEPSHERLGEGILRDFRSRYGRVKVLGPASTVTREGIDTRPQVGSGAA